MTIPTEPIGSIPRPVALIEAVEAGVIADPNLDQMYEAAVKDTIERFEATGSPVITDGEQRKFQNFWTYSVHGLPNTARRIQDSIHRRPHPPDAAPHQRAVPVQALRLQLPGYRSQVRAPPAQAGGDISLGAQSDVSCRRAPPVIRATSLSAIC